MKTKRLSSSASLAALYALITLLSAPLSFGVVQFRIAEVLCLLPYYFPESVGGLFLGCALANLLSGNVLDFLFGSLATLLSALSVAYGGRKRHVPALVCLYPVVINALVVGAVLTRGYEELSVLAHPEVYAFNALSVALGEGGVLYLLGLPLLRRLPQQRFFPFLSSHFDCTRDRV